ncbi:MAG: AlkZ family DNA glycosylase [Gemmatirosa sp.]|nr:AlkZ family DNA glycosylase [Gemmatirosa sp.]
MPTASLVARRRLAAQSLVGPPLATPADVVARLGAVQAQDYAGAKWALAQRSAGATDADVERAFADGAILRTHVLRPTWHFVAPADIRWMLALTGPRVRALMTSYDRTLGLTDDVYRRSHAAIAQALEGGRTRERGELAEALGAAGIDTAGTQRLAHLVMRAELDGVVCSGPRRGSQSTYALLDERVAPAAPIERDDALGRLTARYFTTRGPATLQDFAWWSGLTVADAKRGVEIVGDALVRETLDGRAHWHGASAPEPGEPTGIAHLLPNYDEQFIGHRDRAAVLGRMAHLSSEQRSAALWGHVVAIDGELVGGWKRAPSKRGVVVTYDLPARLRRGERAAIAAAEARYATFLGVPVTRAAR